MFRNYVKIAWRNLLKHKLFSFINIFGLASGITVCMLALIKIKDAYDYDTFHPNSHLTYRIVTNLNRKNGEHFLCASSPLPLSDFLKTNYAAITKSSAVHFYRDQVTANKKELFVKAAFTDADFYSIFGFTLRSGSPAIKPQSVVLTSETAERFFGKANPIGQTITIGKATGFVVTGVLDKPPFPSHLKFDLLASTSAISLLQPQNASTGWQNEAGAYTYIQLKTGTSRATLANILNNATKQVNPIIASSGKSFVFESQALSDISPGKIPMYNTTEEPIFPNLVAFAAIGLSILLLALFNYVNLTLARSLDRAKEVGIRKVAGAQKSSLVLQFLTESVVVAILAFWLANLQLRLISQLPTVQNIIGGARMDGTLWFYFIAFTVITGLLAGWIPARVLSAYQPVKVLKGKFNTRLFGGVGLRKTLTVIQFAVSLIAIVTLAVFYRQSVYMATADYGFDRKQILNISLPKDSYEKTATALSTVAGAERVAAASGLLGFSGADTRFIKQKKESDSISAAYFSVTPSFLTNLGIKLIAGETLPDVNYKASRTVLVNEEACKALRFKEPFEAVGKTIWLNDTTQYTISGVVQNFHYASFLRSIQPLMLANNPAEFRILNLKVAKGAEQTILPALVKAWKKLYPNQPFEANWFDKQLYDQHLHKDDLMFLGVLTTMSLSIACLGLLGMVIYTTNNRSKEVSIRRVLGAGVKQVIVEISREFVNILLISICIGLPIGFLVGKQFLQQYAYQIPIGFGILASSAGGLLALGVITIGWYTYRSALTNPAKSLRIE